MEQEQVFIQLGYKAGLKAYKRHRAILGFSRGHQYRDNDRCLQIRGAFALIYSMPRKD